MTIRTPYPSYKPSGIDWIGDIPSHWETRRLKQVARFLYGDSLTSEDREDGDVQVFGSNGVVGKHTSSNTFGPALVIGRKGSYGKLNWSENPAFAIDTTYFVDRRTTKQDIRWLFYVMGTLGLDQNSKDSAIPGLARDDAYESILAVPPVDEQRAIADYLDRKDDDITRFIESRRRMIALLEEKKQAIINQAVTRGLDPTVPMKDSGVEWLGEIPVHWEVRRLKQVAHLHRGYDLTASDRVTGDVPVISSGGVAGYHNQAMSAGPGVVMGRYGSTKNLFYVEVDFWPHNTSLYVDDFCGNNQRFTYWLLGTINVEAFSAKSAVPGVDRNDLHEILVAHPPLDEQVLIATELDHIASTVRESVLRFEREIELVQEYRTRLISDVVTGKVSVT